MANTTTTLVAIFIKFLIGAISSTSLSKSAAASATSSSETALADSAFDAALCFSPWADFTKV